MSRIAQKLCDEIVECPLKRSGERDHQRSSTSRCFLQSRSSNITPEKENKTTRSIVVEKKRVINKVVPNDLSASRIKFKSKETLLRKEFVDRAVNTTVTGRLRCDNDCVTLVRKRDNKCSCKGTQKRPNFKASAKLIQTFDTKEFNFTDKACAQCIETVSCGTQFLENLGGIIKTIKTVSPIGVMKCGRDIEHTDIRETDDLRQRDLRQEDLGLADFRQEDLRKIDLKHRDFRHEDLTQDVLRKLDLKPRVFKQDLRKAGHENLRKIDFKPEDFRSADFIQDDLTQRGVRQADMRQPDFSQRDFKEAGLRNTDIVRQSDFGQTDFKHAAETSRSKSFSRTSHLNYMGARRWALSQYSTRGPDF